MQRINGERKGLGTATSSTFRPRITRDVNNYCLRVSVLVFWITPRSEGTLTVIGQSLLWQHHVFFKINVKNAIASLFYIFFSTITCVCFFSERSWQPSQFTPTTACRTGVFKECLSCRVLFTQERMTEKPIKVPFSSFLKFARSF